MKESQGSLSGTSVPGLLDAIYRQKDPAGVLEIVKEPVKKRFFFKDGKPVSATSNVLGEVLGRLLMEEGVITQAQYEESLEKVINEKKRHGEVLISMGYLTEDKLIDFLSLQLKRRLWKIFSWDEGTFRYVKADSLPEGLTLLPLHPARLILDGISLGFYPARRVKTDIKDFLDQSVEKSARALERYRPEDFGMNLQEKRLLESFDGKKTLRQVLDGSDLLSQRALSLALSFLVTGVIKAAGEEEEESRWEDVLPYSPGGGGADDTKLNAELMFMKARSALLNDDYAGAVDLLEQITELNPVEGEYWAYLGWARYKKNPQALADAEQTLKDAIDLNNELDSAWYFLGMVSLEAGKTELAGRAFATAVTKNPWNLKALAELKRLEIARSARPDSQEERAREKYLDFYGFRYDPFAELPRPAALALTGAESEALGFLVKGIKKKSGPLLLEGPRGTGKTSIALKMLYELSSEKVLCLFLLKPPARDMDFIEAVNDEAASATDAPAVKEQLLSLGMRLSQNKIQGGHSVLVIDEAQGLSPVCLKLIQYLSRLKTLQIVLLAGPELSERLKDPAFNELDRKIAGRFSLGPLTIEQTHNYIMNRLEKAGPQDNSFTLEYEAVKAVFEKSSGVPALINRYAAALLSSGAEHKTFVLDESVAEAALNKGPRAAEEAPAKAATGVEPEHPGGRAAEPPRAAAPPVEPEPAPPAPEAQTAIGPAAAPGARTGGEKRTSALTYAIALILIILAALVVGGYYGVFNFPPFGREKSMVPGQLTREPAAPEKANPARTAPVPEEKERAREQVEGETGADAGTGIAVAPTDPAGQGPTDTAPSTPEEKEPATP